MFAVGVSVAGYQDKEVLIFSGLNDACFQYYD